MKDLFYKFILVLILLFGCSRLNAQKIGVGYNISFPSNAGHGLSASSFLSTYEIEVISKKILIGGEYGYDKEGKMDISHSFFHGVVGYKIGNFIPAFILGMVKNTYHSDYNMDNSWAESDKVINIGVKVKYLFNFNRFSIAPNMRYTWYSGTGAGLSIYYQL